MHERQILYSRRLTADIPLPPKAVRSRSYIMIKNCYLACIFAAIALMDAKNRLRQTAYEFMDSPTG